MAIAFSTGKLRRRIALEKYAPNGQDTAGQDIEKWAEVATVWAGIDTNVSKQIALNAIHTVASTATHIVSIRFFAGIRPGRWRVRYGDLPVNWADLSTDQWEILDADEWEALTTNPTSNQPRYFSINAVANDEQTSLWTVLYCTEDQG